MSCNTTVYLSLLTVINLFSLVKIFVVVIVIFGIRNTLYHAPKYLFFVACRLTSNIIVIGYAELSWGDVKTVKSGKISDIVKDIS